MSEEVKANQQTPADKPRPRIRKRVTSGSGLRKTAINDPTSARRGEFKKSAETTRRILDAAIHCFVQYGYYQTTVSLVAETAGVVRGAVLYHFADRLEIIRAAVGHLHERRLALFLDMMSQIPSDGDRIDHWIEGYWARLRSPLFVAFQELAFASRTDPELHAILKPATIAFEQARLDLHRKVFPDLADSTNERFLLGRELVRYLLDGMAVGALTYAAPKLTQELLSFLKDQIRQISGTPLRGSAADQISDPH